jgi:VanZ family protein
LSTPESWRNPRPAPELAGLGPRVPLGSLFPASRIIEPILRWFLPATSAASLDFIHHIIRKCAHFAEYFIFFLLLYRGLRGIRRGWQLAPAVLAWFIAAGYSALDEVHQSFVASRGASSWDSLLDSASALAAVVMVFLFYRLRRSTNK